MNWSDEDIDNLFQDAAKQQEIPFREEFWTEMEALLPQQKKKSRAIYWLAGAFVGIIGLSSLLFIQEDSLENKHLTAGKESLQIKTLELHVAKVNPALLTETNSSSNLVENLNQQYSFNGKGVETPYYNINQEKDKTHEIPTTEIPALTQKEFIQTDILTLKTLETIDGINSELMLLAGVKPLLNRKKPSFYTQVDAGMNRISNESETGNPWSPSLAISLGYEKRFNNFSLELATRFSALTTNNLQLSREAKVYHFSSTMHVLEMQYKQLYQIELPLSVGYTIGKHSLSAGVSPTYLVSSRMTYNHFEDNQLTEQGNIYGQRLGLRSFNVSFQANYSLELMNNFHAGVQVSSMVLNPIQQNTFNSFSNKNPLNVQFTFRKFIF